MLGERGGVAVVLERDRPSEPFRHQLPQRHVGEGNVDGAVHSSCLLVDPGRQPEPNRGDRVVEQLVDGGADLVDQTFLGVEIGGPFAAMLDLPGRVDDPGEDLRPADIDPDYAPICHPSSHCGAEGM